MAVLVEGISVIVRRDAIDAVLPGGWLGFVANVPNATLCADDHLARVGFMSPEGVQTFIDQLERSGLRFSREGRCQDIAVVDQLRGPTLPADWLEYAQIPFGQTGGKVSVCWLFEGQRLAAGVHLPGSGLELATPEGWHYEESLSAKFTFVPTGDGHARLRFLRTEHGADVFLDTATGKEVFAPPSSAGS